MDESRRPATRGAWGPAPGFIVIAIGLVAGALAGWWSLAAAPPASAAETPAPASVGVAASAVSAPRQVVIALRSAAPAVPAPARPASVPAPAVRHVVRTHDPDGDTTPDLSDYVNDGDVPTTAEAIARLHEAGIRSGLGAFSPPGTRPLRLGLAVPEGFPLPEGYVRHYQATDDGQRVEPILMFSPDYQFLDANHQPIAIPADRVVPPEMAPPGMPIRRITLPPPIDPAGPPN